MKQKPNCIIYITDLYGNLNFKNASKVPTLWAVTASGACEKDVPFGYAIRLKDDGVGEDKY
jgi:predicted metal-dependent peptidase